MGKGVLIIMLASLAAAMMMMRSSQEAAVASENLNSDQEGALLAREIARSAINTAIAQARRDFANAENISYDDVPYQDGEFDVAAARPTPGTVELTATGRYGEFSYQIKTTLVESTPLDAPLIFDVPSIDAKFNGPNYELIGIDTAPPSAPGQTSSPESDRTAIRTSESSVRDDLLDEIGAGGYDQVVGVNGEGDVESGPLSVDPNELFDQASANRDFTTDGAGLKNKTWGSPNAPVIVYCEGDAKVSGQSSGYGILVINGDLENASGQFQWEGIVIVKGNTPDVKLTGGGSIYGALVVISTGGEAEFRMGAQAEIKYSSEAIGRIVDGLPVLEENQTIIVADQWSGE